MLLLNYEPSHDYPDVNGNTPLDHLVWIVISESSASAISSGARWFIDLLCELDGADTNVHNATNCEANTGYLLRHSSIPRLEPWPNYAARLYRYAVADFFTNSNHLRSC